MSINWKYAILGAGLFLIWMLAGNFIGAFSSIPATIWIVIGVAPAYYMGKVSSAGGYIGMFLVIYLAFQQQLANLGGA
jgi:hypothetical protein